MSWRGACIRACLVLLSGSHQQCTEGVSSFHCEHAGGQNAGMCMGLDATLLWINIRGSLLMCCVDAGQVNDNQVQAPVETPSVDVQVKWFQHIRMQV